MHWTIHQRKPLGQWEFENIIEGKFEDAANACWDLLVENGGEAVETRFAKTHYLVLAKNWTYIPQFIEDRPE